MGGWIGGLVGWSVGLFVFSSVTIYLSVCSFACSVWLVGRAVGWSNAYLFGWSASCLVSVFVFVCFPIYLYASLFLCLLFVSI